MKNRGVEVSVAPTRSSPPLFPVASQASSACPPSPSGAPRVGIVRREGVLPFRERERESQSNLKIPHTQKSLLSWIQKTARVVVVVVALLEKKKSLQNVSSFLVPFFRVGGAFLERQSHAPEKDDDDA